VEYEKMNNSMSRKIKEFSSLELDKSIAEQMFSQASSSLEMARIQSDRKMMYLHKITSPALAEEQVYTYPYRLFFFFLFSFLLLVFYIILNVLVGFVRERIY
jgi:capsular polysaccharide transport system permease protein